MRQPRHTESIRPLCSIGRAPGTRPPPTPERNGSRENALAAWDAAVTEVVRRIVQAEDANGGPLTTHKLLTLLRKLAPKTIAPLVKRGKLQQDGLIAPLDEGLWVVTDAGRARL